MDQEKLAKLRGLLLNAWTDARTCTERFDPTSREPYQIVAGPDGVGIVLGAKAIKCVSESVDLIAKDELLGKRFSRGVLSSELHSLLLSVFNVNPTDIENKMTQALAGLVDKLERTSMLQWRVLIPIKNLVLKIPSLEIGRVRFLVFEKAMYDETLTTIQKINDSSTSPEPVKKEGMKMITDVVSRTYLSRTVAVATVEAADENQAVTLAEEETEHALNVLRLYGPLGNSTRMRKAFVGPEGTIFRGQYTTLCLAADRFLLPFRTTGYLFEYEIGQDTLALMEKFSLRRLSEILGKDTRERTDFERLLVTAIDFYGLGMNEPSPRDAYIDFAISLESLLLKEGEPRSLLPERVALVVGKDEATRTSLFEQTRDAYRLRSDILHHGFDYVTEDDVWLISRIGFRAITKLIPISTQINDIGKLITMCTKSKFGGPAFAEEIGPSPATPASTGDIPS